MIQIQRQSNSEVTDYYLNVIADIICVDKTEIYPYSHCLRNCNKNDIIVVPTAIDFLKVYLKGFKKIVYWMQGIDGEESYLKHNSMLRKNILDYFTKFALNKASAIFFVSNEMKRYEENKFKLDLNNKSFVMPCFNVSKDTGVIFDEDKYKKNIFSYVGSLSKWQCFSQTVDFYKKIENKYKDVELRVFTFSEEEAKKVLIEKGVKSFHVSSSPPELMTEALREVKFGFVLRDDIPVNSVATPTKLSSYLSAGVIPIYSKCLVDFYEKTQKLEYCVPVSDYSLIPNKLEELIEREINFDVLCEEYELLFDTYYNPNFYIKKYKNRILKLLEI